MAFRFQKRVKIMPGVRLNISKSGISTTLGPRGASVSVGKRGVHANVGVPGTGISYRTKLSGGRPQDGVSAPSEDHGLGFALLAVVGILATVLFVASGSIAGGAICGAAAILLALAAKNSADAADLRERTAAAAWAAEVARHEAEDRAYEAEVREREAARALAAAARRDELFRKYDEAVAMQILDGDVWVGQTAEQLTESLGNPDEIEERVLKTKTKHTWKFKREGANRFQVRVTLEEGLVTGFTRRDR